MQHFSKPEDFLGWLNKSLVVCGVTLRISRRPHGGRQYALPLTPDARLVWSQEFDWVLEGVCSTHLESGLHLGEQLRDFPMGKILTGERHLSWLHTFLQHPSMAGAKHILVFPGCCGSYHESYQTLIQELFPEITWTFPRISDLYDHAYNVPDVVAVDLIQAGILHIE